MPPLRGRQHDVVENLFAHLQRDRKKHLCDRTSDRKEDAHLHRHTRFHPNKHHDRHAIVGSGPTLTLMIHGATYTALRDAVVAA